MGAPDCLFCKIVDRKVPSSIVYETNDVLGFNDVNPQAPTHVLFIPKSHIAGVHEVTVSGQGCMEGLVLAANQVARQAGIDERGYRLVVNCKADAGQTVGHLHLHLLGGRKMTWPPG